MLTSQRPPSKSLVSQANKFNMHVMPYTGTCISILVLLQDLQVEITEFS